MDPIDLEYFREAAMDDDEFMQELADVFRSDTPQQLDRLRAAVSGGDFAETVKAAHRLKGSSGNVGAQSLFALASQLEKAGRSEQTSSAANLIYQVEAEYDRVCDFLETAFADHSDELNP